MALMLLLEFRDPQSAAYRGRKHYTSQNVLADVDFDLKFTYVLPGWEGSAHDASILNDSLNRPDGIHLREGSSTLMMQVTLVGQESSPLRKTRYYLNEFSSRN
jgi:hypothetical protein